MANVEKTVFISYRRTNAAWALAIFQDLTHHGYDVFFDFTGLASGDFERVILENIGARAHFLLLLTPSAIEGCTRPSDWLRREIEAAIRCDRNIVPLMLEGFDFSFPTIASQLTGKLADLKRYNALRVSADYFEESMERLRSKFLNVPLNAVLHPVSADATHAAKKQQAAAISAEAVSEARLTAGDWFERGLVAFDADDKEHSYTQAVTLDPSFAEAFNNRGLLRHDKGDLEGALTDCSEAVRLRPDASTYNNRGLVRGSMGDFKGALQDFTEAMRLDRNDFMAYYNTGLALQKMGNKDGALQAYEATIRLNPSHADTYLNRSTIFRQRFRFLAAAEDLKKYYSLKKKS